MLLPPPSAVVALVSVPVGANDTGAILCPTSCDLNREPSALSNSAVSFDEPPVLPGSVTVPLVPPPLDGGGADGADGAATSIGGMKVGIFIIGSPGAVVGNGIRFGGGDGATGASGLGAGVRIIIRARSAA